MNIREFTNKALNPVDMFSEKWALVSAGDLGNYSCCTLSWGSLGNLWGHVNDGGPIITIYVNPARNTHHFLMENDTFTISFFPEEYRKDLSILGSKSSRDGDKVALTELTPYSYKDNVFYKEASLSFLCRKIYWDDFKMENIESDYAKRMYTKLPPHTVFIGQILEIKQGD